MSSVLHSAVKRAGIHACVLLLLPQGALAASDREVEGLRSELDTTRGELTRTQEELARTRDALGALTQRVDAMAAAAPTATPGATGATARLAPVNADNPAVSFVVDTAGFSDTEDSGAGFDLRGGELFISAPIDPFLRGYTAINGTSEEGFDIEEAALVTTALPWNITVKGGRFFADVGRLSSWHDHNLPFTDRPDSIDRIVGGESGAEGVELSWLAPSDVFFELTGGVYTTIGSEYLEDLNEDGFIGRRSFSELTWLARPHGYFDLTDTLNVEWGGTFAAVPQDDERRLYGVDVTLRHQPGTSRVYQGTDVGMEWLWNDQTFLTDPDDPDLGDERFRREGGYAYVESFLGRRYSVGLLADYSEQPSDAIERQERYGAFVTWKPSEFQRLRFEFDQFDGDDGDNQRFTIQWTAFLGSHTHGFATR